MLTFLGVATAVVLGTAGALALRPTGDGVDAAPLAVGGLPTTEQPAAPLPSSTPPELPAACVEADRAGTAATSAARAGLDRFQEHAQVMVDYRAEVIALETARVGWAETTRRMLSAADGFDAAHAAYLAAVSACLEAGGPGVQTPACARASGRTSEALAHAVEGHRQVRAHAQGMADLRSGAIDQDGARAQWEATTEAALDARERFLTGVAEGEREFAACRRAADIGAAPVTSPAATPVAFLSAADLDQLAVVCLLEHPPALAG